MCVYLYKSRAMKEFQFMSLRSSSVKSSVPMSSVLMRRGMWWRLSLESCKEGGVDVEGEGVCGGKTES